VAAEEGMSKGGVLHDFPSKDRLVEALVARSAENWRPCYMEACGRSPEGPGRMARALLSYCPSDAQGWTDQLCHSSSAGFAALAPWKSESSHGAGAASAKQPQPIESVTGAVAKALEHRQTTTSIGTVIALRSITLRNERPGTVRQVMLTPGHVVDAGTVLVALDISVEEADLKAQEAQAALAETTLDRMQRARQN